MNGYYDFSCMTGARKSRTVDAADCRLVFRIWVLLLEYENASGGICHSRTGHVSSWSERHTLLRTRG